MENTGNVSPPSLEKLWNVRPKKIMELWKSANKYVVLSKDMNNLEFDGDHYFKHRWNAVNRMDESSDEEDIIEENNAARELVADEIGGGISNELRQNDAKKFIQEENIQMIMLGWNPLLRVMMIDITNQAILCIVELIPNKMRSSGKTSDMVEYSDTINSLEVEDICSSRFQFTWTKSIKNPQCNILKNPAVLHIKMVFLKRRADLAILWLIKKSSTNWSKKLGKRKSMVVIFALKERLKSIQTNVDKNPHDVNLKKETVLILNDFVEASKDELKFLQRKAKVKWLKEEEQNTAFFHEKSRSPCLILKVTNIRYTSEFFKKDWEVVGKEVSTPCKVSEFRPIACCNVIYKCISKILTNRIKSGLDKIVHINQSAFIPGRHIQDNILIAQELLRGYNRNNGPQRCAMQIDIQKAYDTASWSFLEETLGKFGFHRKMVTWIMTCVKSTSFSICLNGDMHGFFKGGRGLRQGDPISTYLFTLVMEVFSLIMEKNIEESNEYGYHFGCKDLKLSHMCFADDLLVLCKGNKASIEVVKKSLEEFIRYLGVPLLAKKLGVGDCQILIDKVEERINNWRNKNLSYAGRIQLIASVLASMQMYWASVYLLPITVINDLEKLFKIFLWNVVDSAKGKARVAWKMVCRPKEQGGLGIKSLKKWNEVLLIRQFLKIIEDHNSLRDIYDARLDDDAKVVDLINNGQWIWPDGWKEKYLVINNLDRTVNLTNKDEKVLWITNDGKKQAFILWMTVEDKLLTQDKIDKWQHGGDLKCGFCKQYGDSLHHLFFQCDVTKKIWCEMLKLTYKMDVQFKLLDVVDALACKSGKRSIGNVVNKIVLAATVYFIWQERNFREQK
ncbi:RNA-directed DNA polymerase, eukaryota, reverse transcriptase zinc-binding domain protein [Tanacetum coccineum]